METEQAKTTSWIDAHCHLDLFKNEADILADIENNGVRTVAVTNAPSVFHHTLELAKRTPLLCPAVGLHPELVASRGRELQSMWPMLEQTRFVGEIGLDYVTNDEENRRAQRGVFTQIVERCAQFGDKILTVHSRRSASDVISVIGDRFPGKAILHWFSGSRAEVDRAIAFGFFFSVGPAMVRSKTGRALLARMPRERVLTETDGPFVESNYRPARPSDVMLVIAEISQLWGQTDDETRAVISGNFDSMTR